MHNDQTRPINIPNKSKQMMNCNRIQSFMVTADDRITGYSVNQQEVMSWSVKASVTECVSMSCDLDDAHRLQLYDVPSGRPAGHQPPPASSRERFLSRLSLFLSN